MKKIISLLSFLSIISIITSAQIIPNTDMEDWQELSQNKVAPIGWITTNQTSNNFSRTFINQSTNSYSGDFALQMVNHIVGNGACYSSSLRLGNFDPDNPTAEGIAFSQRPTGMSFYYTFHGHYLFDSLFMGSPILGNAKIQLKKWDDATNEFMIVGEGTKYFGKNDNTTEFEYAEVNIQYYSADDPEILEISFKNPCDNDSLSEFTIDVVELRGLNSTNINETSPLSEINVFPNPAKDLLTFESVLESDKNTSIQIFNMQGKLMSQFNFLGNQQRVDVSNWSNGMYFYQISNEREKLKSGKVSILK
ncbi:MAG: T9SS type A sorting domain-containing protein [Saprospiraceae bacterium]